MTELDFVSTATYVGTQKKVLQEIGDKIHWFQLHNTDGTVWTMDRFESMDETFIRAKLFCKFSGLGLCHEGKWYHFS